MGLSTLYWDVDVFGAFKDTQSFELIKLLLEFQKLVAGILGKSALSLGRFSLEGAFCAVVAFDVRVEDVT